MTPADLSSASTLSAGADYFTVFGLSRKLVLDTRGLERSFYRLSRELHPDRFAQASAEKQAWSLEQSSLLNDAYRTLKQPLTRTEYLLKLEGVELADEKDTKTGPKNVPPELLAEVFELNMQLEEMRMNRKMGEDDPQLRRDLEAAKGQFSSQLVEIDLALEGEWARWDASVDAAGGEAAGSAAKSAMAALMDRRRYVRNLVRDVNQALL